MPKARKVAKQGGRTLRKSRYVSFFRKKDEIYAYHDLWGYILQMDRKVCDFIHAFGEGRNEREVSAEFADRFRPEEAEGFIGTFVQHRCLVPPRLDEETEAFERGHPVYGPWTVHYAARPEEVILAVKDRSVGRVVLERLERVASRFFLAASGEKTCAEIADALEKEYGGGDVRTDLRRLVFRLTHSDRQALKLVDRPIFEYLAFPPPYLRSTMPFPRLEDARDRDGEGPEVVDLAAFHRREVEDAAAQFDVEETTLSHMFREPHEALSGKTYGEAFAHALLERALLPRGGAANVVEVGGGVGFFALRFLRAVEEEDRDLYAGLRYAIVDLSQVLQDSQRMLTFGLERKARFVRANASRGLPLRDGSVDLLLSNEVIADLETVRLRRADVAAGRAPARAHPSVREAVALARRHDLPLDDAPEVFWLNLGALRLLEELPRVLRPGGAAVLVEFGGESRYPVESTHLSHGEFSIHFGHLAHVAARIGLSCELLPVMDLIGLKGDVRVLATTKSFFEALRALLGRRGISLQKLAYTEQAFKDLVGERIEPRRLHGLSFKPIKERALGLHPPEFLAAVLRKPAP
jgi:SAM-dependent methyltransferase